MPLTPLLLKPGVDVEMTPMLNATGWSESQLVRFVGGMPEKLGGWSHLSATALVGLCRRLHAWADLAGFKYIVAGTSERLTLFLDGTFYDITPLRATENVAVDFSTVIGTKTVTIVDAGHGGSTGDWVDVMVPVAVGGLVLYGLYEMTVTSANAYTIQAAANAAATVNNGGAVPLYTTTLASANVVVTLAAHGYGIGSSYTVNVTTVSGGITMTAGVSYGVTAVGGVNTFTIVPGPLAGANDADSENGGLARFLYLVPSGYASATPLAGYGIGAYGAGPYGLASGATIIASLRRWWLDNWGEDLIGNYTASPMYVWIPPAGFQNRALAINTTNFPGALDPPAAVNASYVSAPTRIAVALGCDDGLGGDQDSKLIRWTDVDDYLDWRSVSGNQAGEYRIPTGSAIIGGLQMALFGLIWTDFDLWLQTYIGYPGVFAHQQVTRGCGLIGGGAAGVYKNLVFWASLNGFFVFDGNGVRVLDCTVWDFFHDNLDDVQTDKVICAVNSMFNEITWYFQTDDADEVDAYVQYQAIDDIWSYGYLSRTAWIDTSIMGQPIGVDSNGLMQQHEVAYDADGQAMVPSIRSGWFGIAEGTLVMLMERLYADAKCLGGNQTLRVTVYAKDTPSPEAAERTYGPFTWTPAAGPPTFITRARGRYCSIEISSNVTDNWWRLGRFRMLIKPTGRR